MYDPNHNALIYMPSAFDREDKFAICADATCAFQYLHRNYNSGCKYNIIPVSLSDGESRSLYKMKFVETRSFRSIHCSFNFLAPFGGIGVAYKPHMSNKYLNDAPYEKCMLRHDHLDKSHKQAELTLLKNKEELKKLVTLNELVLNQYQFRFIIFTQIFSRTVGKCLPACSKSLSFEAYKQGELCYKSAKVELSPVRGVYIITCFAIRQTELIKFKL